MSATPFIGNLYPVMLIISWWLGVLVVSLFNILVLTHVVGAPVSTSIRVEFPLTLPWISIGGVRIACFSWAAGVCGLGINLLPISNV